MHVKISENNFSAKFEIDRGLFATVTDGQTARWTDRRA